MKLRRAAFFAALVLGAVSVFSLTPLASAQTYQWDPLGTLQGSDSSGTWDTVSGIWAYSGGDTTWTDNNIAQFGYGTAGSYTVTLATNVSPLGIILGTNGSDSYTIAGTNLLTIGASGIMVNTSGAISAPITLGAAQTWTTAIGQTLTVSGAVNNGGNLLTLASADATGATTISGAISGGGGLTSRGAGLATLSGLNTYTGPTNVTAGTLDIAAGGAVSGTSLVNPTGGSVLTIEGSVSMAPNGTFAVGSANGNSGTINVNPGAVVNIGNGSGGTVGGTYIGGYINASGSGPGVGTLNINGGILNVAAAGTVNGGDGSHLWLNPWGGSGSTINLNGGTLSTARPISNGTGSSAAYFYFNGGTLQADASINILDNSALTTYVEAAGATIDTNGYNATIYPALLSGVANDGGVTKIGAGSLTLAGNNTYTGPTTITAGTLVLTGDTTYLGGNLNINNGSTLTLTGGEQYWFYSKSFIFDANGGGTINATGGVNFVIGGADTFATSGGAQDTITGASGINLNGGVATFNVVRGSSAVDLNLSANIWNRGGIIQTGNGIMTITNNNGGGWGTTVSGGTLQLGNGGNSGSLGGGGITDNATLVFDRSDGLSIGVQISGSGAVYQNGSGTTTLSANNSYTGGTFVNQGTLQLNVGGGIGTLGANSNVTVNGGGTLLCNNTDVLGYGNGSAANLTVNSGGLVNVTAGNRVTLWNAVNMTGGTLTSAAGNGDGTGNYSLEGQLNATSDAAGNPAVVNATQLGLQNPNTVFNVTQGPLAPAADLIVSSVVSSWSGGAGMTKTGNGVMVLSANNTYSGGTTIGGGTLQVGNGGNSGTLGSGGVTNNATLVFDRSDALLNVANSIGGSGMVVQNGSGTMVLSGNNTYAGPTNVNSGGLYVNGALPSTGTVNVAPGATLGGTGSVGQTFVASGGAIDVSQNGASTLTLAGLSFSGNGTINLPAPNVSNLPIQTGSLAVGGGAGSIQLVFPSTANFADGLYPLIGYSGAIGGTGFAGFTVAQPAALGVRRSAVLQNNAGQIDYVVSGDTPYWNGQQSDWQATNAWALQPSNTLGTYLSGDNSVFDDTAASGTVTLNQGNVSPISATFNNNTLPYSLSGAYGIVDGAAGATFLVKNGAGSLTIATSNGYSGGTQFNAGTLAINNPSALGTGMLSISGGTLDNTSGAAVTLATNNPQAWNGDFAFLGSNDLNLGAGAVTLGGNRTVTVIGGNLTVGGAIGDQGLDLGLTKAGGGNLILTGANTYAGPTTISGGTLQIGNGAADGSLSGTSGITDNSALVYNLLGSQTFGNVISGNGSLSKTGPGTLVLTANNTYSGATTVNNGTLQVGNGGSSGGLGSGNIVDNGTLVYNLSSSSTVSLPSGSVIAGSGNLNATAGVIQFNGNISLSGSQGYTQNSASGLYQGLEVLTTTTLTGSSISLSGDVGTTSANSGAVALNLDTSAVNGTINLNVSTGGNNRWFGLSGLNANAGTGTINVTGNGLDATDGFNNTPITLTGAVNITGNVTGNVGLTINSTANGTVSGNISGTMPLTKQGPAVLTLTGNNTYTGGTTVSAGTLQLGDGATANGSVAGNITNNATLTIANPTAQTFSNVVSGTGRLVKAGNGTLTLTATQNYSGPTVVSGGVLQLQGGEAGFSNGLVDYYPFAGTANDVIGGVNGTLGSGVTLSTTGGKFGNGAVYLPGNGGGVTMGALPSFTNGSQARTISAWVQQVTYPNTWSADYFGFFPASSQSHTGFYFDQNGGIAFTEYSNDTSGNCANNTSWNLLTATWDGNNNDSVQIYVNGALKTTLSAPTGGVLNDFGIDIGRTGFNGYEDDLRVYNVALSATQVAQLYSWNGVGGGNNLLPITTDLTINAGSTLDLCGGTQQVATLGDYTPGLGGSIVNSSASFPAVLTLSPTGGTTTFSGAIAGGGTLGSINLVMNGTGTQVLAGSNTYTGTTTITSGMLQLASSSAASPNSTFVIEVANGLVFGNGVTSAVLGGLSGSANQGLSTTDSPPLPVALAVGGNNQNTTYSGVLSDGAAAGASLLKTGTGTLTLMQGNTYTGGTTIANGAITQGAANILPAGGAVTFGAAAGNTSGALELNGYAATFNAAQLSVAGGANNRIAGGSATLSPLTLNVAGGTATLAVGLGGSGTNENNLSLTKVGNGTLVLAAANSYTGGATVNAGTLQGNTSTLATNVALNGGNVVFDQAASGTYSNVVSGVGSFTKANAGVLNVSTSQTYSGPTIISGGTLQFAGAPTSPVPGYAVWFDASNLGLANGAAVTSLTDLSGNGNNASAVTSGATGNPTYTAGALNGLGAVTFTGKEALTFPEDTSIRTTFSIFKGSSFLMTDTNSYNFHRNQGNDNDPSAPLWDGPTSHGWASGNITSGTTTVDGVVADWSTTDMPTSANNGFNLVEVQTTGNVSANGFNDDRNFTHYAGNGGNGSQEQGEVLIYNTPLTAAQSLANQEYLMYKWFGVTTPGSADNNLLPTSTPVIISNGAALNLGGGTQTIASLSSTDGLGSQVLLGGGMLTVGDSTSTTFDGVISGSGGSLVKQGGGSLTFTGTSSYSGSTTIIGGVLSVANLANGGANSSIGASTNSAANLLIDGGTLQYVGPAASTDRLFTVGSTTHIATIDASGSGPLTFSNAGAVIYADNSNSNTIVLTGSNTAANTFNPPIHDPQYNGNTSLAKNGAGTWVLAGQSDYTGPTTINAGKLILAAGSSLDETAITVAGGAILAPQPGNSVMTTGIAGGLSAGATLTLLNGSTFDMTDGGIGGFVLQEPSNSVTGLSLLGATLKFDVGPGGADSLSTNGLAAVSSVNMISITGLSGLATGTYPLITAAGGMANDFSLSASTVSVGGTTYSLALLNSSTAESLVVSAVAPPVIINGVWANGSGGNWSAQGNWSGHSVPGVNGSQSANDTATFGVAATSGSTVTITLDTSPQVSAMTFSSTSSYVLQGSGTLTLSATNGMATVTASTGAHTISVPLVLASSADMAIAAGAQLSISGNISGAGALSLTNSGELVLGGADSYQGGTTVGSGTLVFTNSGSVPAGGALIVGAGGIVSFDPSVTAGAVELESSPQVAAGPMVMAATAHAAGGAVEAVPEPGTLALLLAAFWSVAMYCRFPQRRR